MNDLKTNLTYEDHSANGISLRDILCDVAPLNYTLVTCYPSHAVTCHPSQAMSCYPSQAAFYKLIKIPIN